MKKNNLLPTSWKVILVVALIPLLIIFASCARIFMVVTEPASLPPARILEKPPQVVLVLGGGAFHGAAHVGVIKVLEEENIPIDLIIGTSAGSLVGAMYADYPNIDSLIPLVTSIKAKDVFDFSLFRSSEGYVSGKRLQSYLTEHLHNKNIEDTPIPFVAVTTDLNRAKSVPLAAGPIAPSVNASCAIPYIFEPVKMYGTVFVDGGVLNNIAVDIAKSYDPLVIIAVNVMADFDTTPTYKNKIAVLMRSMQVASHNMGKDKIQLANIVISPDLRGMPLMSAKDNMKMLDAGIVAARQSLPKIKEFLKKKGVKN